MRSLQLTGSGLEPEHVSRRATLYCRRPSVWSATFEQGAADHADEAWLALAGVGGVAALAATGALGVTGSDKITTVAGISKFGTGGYSGDGGPATKAQLAQPKGVAVDAQGNIYIADARNKRVRKVTPSGRSPRSRAMGRKTPTGRGTVALRHPHC